MDMDANEAKKLADMVSAKRAVASYLATIEQSAKSGNYETRLGPLDNREVEALRLLGFTVEQSPAGSTSVRWGTVRN
jgi:hypothetical protein